MEYPRPETPTPATADSGRQQRRLLLWLALALGGLIMLMLCAFGSVLYFVLDGSTLLQGQAEPDLPAPPESPRPAKDIPLPGGPLMLVEDFEQPTNRWDQSRSRVVDGTYELRVDTPNFDSYGLFLNARGPIQDFDLAVDATQVAGDPTAEYGIRFRQSGPGDYLMFSISGSGYYRLVRVTDQMYQSVVPWTFDSGINTGPDAGNRLRVVARGDSITAFLNDRQVIAATDEVIAGGQLTLGLTTFDQGGLVVRFDNMAGSAQGQNLAEDFNDPEDVAWSIGGATIREGGYALFAGGGVQSWQQPLPAGVSEVDDFILEVDAALEQGTAEGVGYGVMFGDGGSFDFYSLFILPNGSVTLLVSDGAGNRVALLEPTPVDAVNTEVGATNHIRVTVRDSVITIALNNEELPAIESPFLVQGEVGMIVTSSDTGSVQARFDNFQLRAISESQQQV